MCEAQALGPAEFHVDPHRIEGIGAHISNWLMA